jgi:WD40 repeat protein
VRRAIAHTADHVYNVELSSSQQVIARNIFLRLTELGEEGQDTRRRIQITELIPPGPAGESEQIQAVLLVLADARLITTGDGTVEVAHEALIREWPLLREWLTEGREGLRLHRHLTEASQEWELLGRDPGALYRGARLAQAVEWALENPQQQNSLEQAFIGASREAAEQEETEREAVRQRELEQAQELARVEAQHAEEQFRAAQGLRRRAMLLLGAVIIAVGLAAAALFFASQSRENASMAAIRQAEAEANAVLAQSQKATAEAEGQIRATAEFVAIQQRQMAEQQTTLTRSRELALAAINNLETNPELSILLSLEGLAVTHTLEAESALHRSLLASHLEDRLPAPYLPIRPSMTYSPDGSKLAYLVAAPNEITTTLVLEDQNNGTTLLQVEKPGWLGDQFHQVSIAFSPDGKMLVAGMSNDPELQFWDSATGKEIRSLDLIDNAATNACEWRFGKFQAGIYAVRFSPDGSWFGTVECDGGQMFVRARDATTGVPLFSTPFSGVPNPLAKVVISADGARIAGDPMIDGHVVVLDALSGEGLFRLKHNQGVDDKYENMLRAIAADPQSNRIATVGWGDVVRVWDANTGEQLQAIAVGSPEVWGVAFSPDGTQLATGSPDGKTRLWDIDTGKELLTLTGSNERIFDVLFHPDGESLIARDFSSAAIWDITPGHELFTLEENSTNNHLEISPGGDRLATADNEGHVKVLDAQTGEKLLDIPAHEGYVNWVNFSPDGSQIASASADGKVKTWDSKTGKLLSTLQDGSDAFFASMFNPKGGQLAAIGCCDPALNIWDVSTGEIITTIIRPEDVVWNGVTGIYDSSGERLFSDHIIWDAQTGEVLANLDVSLVEQDVTVADFSPDGRQIALGGYNGYLIFYDTNTGEAGQPIQAHSGPIWSMDYSPDGSRLATASVDGTVKLWDSSTGALQLTLGGYPQPVTGVVFSPDGRMLYTADNNGQVRGYILPIDELVSLAHSRLTRNFSQDECLNYRISPCPINP